MSPIKQGYLHPKKKKRSTDVFVRTPFHTPCPARYSVLHLFCVLSGGNIASPYGRGGSRRLTERVISLPLTRYRGNSPRGRAFDLCLIKVRLLFLTSTAFVGTKTKPRAGRGERLIKKFFDVFQMLCCFLYRIRKHFRFFQNVFIDKIFKTLLNGCCIHTNVFLKNICQIFTS